MYKTVRKGDASLQYTILPQTDQFSSGGFPQASGKPRPRIIRYTMATIMVLIILSCVATPFLMNQNDHNLFASTMRAISRAEPVRNTSKNQTKNISEGKNRSRILTTTVSTTEITRRKDLEDGTTSFNVILRGEEEEEEAMVDDATLAGIVLLKFSRQLQIIVYSWNDEGFQYFDCIIKKSRYVISCYFFFIIDYVLLL